MVKAPGDGTTRYAPTNERELGGVIMYSMDATPTMVKRRREDAYKKMHDACKGPYRIVAEGERVEGGVVSTSATTTASATGWKTTGTSTAENWRDWYIQFACGTKAG